MLVQHAHLQAIRGVRDLMVHEIAYEDMLFIAAKGFPCREFRTVVAHRALTFLSWKVGRILVPVGDLAHEKFCEQVAIAIACTAEKDRPSSFSKYSAGQFAHALLDRYMRSYRALDDLGFPDAEIHHFTLDLENIPTDPGAALRNQIAMMSPEQFGRYTFPS